MTNKTYGYIRVSTLEQSTDRQLANIRGTLDHIFEEKISGKTTNRPEFQTLNKVLVRGDTVYVHEISRLGRSTKDLLSIVDDWKERGVTIKFLKENITFSPDKSDAMSNMIFSMMSSLSQFEREQLLERQSQGIAAAKLRGVQFGAANNKYNKTNHISKSLHKSRTEILDKLRPDVENVLSLMDNKQLKNCKKTFNNIAKNLNMLNVPSPTGNSWNSGNTSRAIEYYGITR